MEKGQDSGSWVMNALNFFKLADCILVILAWICGGSMLVGGSPKQETHLQKQVTCQQLGQTTSEIIFGQRIRLFYSCVCSSLTPLLIKMLSSHLVIPFRKLFIRHSCVFGNHLHFIALPFVRLLYLLYLLEVLLTNKTHLELSSLAISMALGDIPKAVAELPVALASSGLQKGVSYS